MTFADLLNASGAMPNPGDARVDLDSLEHADELEGTECWLDEHPEGAKRGGYVPYASLGGYTAMYDQIDEAWVDEDEED